jgi:ABC-type Na+ efflux pump permease subunit
VWTITSKDFGILRKKKTIIYTMVAFPLAMGLGFSGIIWLVLSRNNVAIPDLFPLFAAFEFFFIIFASSVPTGMASYSIVGEKIEKSLEPLLATPATDDEILLGKSLASFLASITATYLGAIVYMIGIDIVTLHGLGYPFYPNWDAAVFLFAATPFVSLFSVELSIIVSSRVNDVRAANQFGGLLVLPFAALYVLGEINVVSLTTGNLLIMSAILALIDAGLFFLSRATFRRDQILTKWK